MNKSRSNFRFSLSNRGQVLIEYLLLMVIAVSCATLLTEAFVGRGGDKQGMIIKQWNKILQTIGNDLPDCSKQSAYATANCPP